MGLYHADGITPEALFTDVFDGKAPEEEFVITRKDLDDEAEKDVCAGRMAASAGSGGDALTILLKK